MHPLHYGAHAAYGHAYGHAVAYGGHAAASGFLGQVMHVMFNAAIYSMIFRLLRHVPLPVLVLLVVIVVFVGWRRARSTGRSPW